MRPLLLALCLWLLPALSYAAPSFVNAGAEGEAASGNITLGAPATPVAGDVWIAAIHSSDQITHAFTDWTPIVQGNGGGTTSHLSIWCFTYVGVTPNLIVTHTAGDGIVGGIAAFRGVEACASQPDTLGTVTAETGAGSTSIEHATITPVLAGTLLLAINGSNNDNTRDPIPTTFAAAFTPGTTNNYEQTVGVTDGSVAIHYVVWASGATGSIVDTQSAAAAYASYLVALKPAIASIAPPIFQ